MTSELRDIYFKLKNLKENLYKLSYRRRTSELLNKKLEEASLIFAEFLSLNNNIKEQICKKELSGQTLLDIQSYCDSIKDLYSLIENFCSKSYTSSNFEIESKSEIMDTFDLKVALTLLPCMNDEESTTKQLIDNIEYYDSILNSDAKPKLISFVLKSRLSQMAKLKLLPSYASVQDLLQDMKKELLPKKSATTIQFQMQNIRQGEDSIDEYGKKLAEMFTNLTIAQSEGNPDAFKILRKLNENQAIKRFSDGLRNRRISTIIAARNYESLKDAIQGAMDQETTSSSSTADLFSYNHRKKLHNFSNRGRASFTRTVYPTSYYNRGQRTFRPQGHGAYCGTPSTSRGQYQSTGTRYNRGFRGKSNYFRGNVRSRNPNRHNVVNIINESVPQKDQQNFEIPNEFFREQ